MPRPSALLARFWRSDESLTILLGLLLIMALAMPALWPGLNTPGPAAIAIFSAMLFVGAATVWRRGRWVVRAVGILCVLAVPGQWVAWWRPSPALATWNAATEAIVLVVLAMVVLTTVLHAGSITRRQIEGAIAAYLLLGLAWAAAYEWISLQVPGAFSGAAAADFHQWSYYSLVTLTTMGYGDITPVHPAARSLAVAEALTGQLYVAILIARLVSLQIAARKG